MLPLRFYISITFISALTAAAGDVFSAGYPSKPIRVTSGSPGSGADFAARQIAQGLTAGLGQPAVVENRASGVTMGEIVSRATPDGHTLLIISNTFWLQPFLQEKLSWDPVRDFRAITLVASTPNLIVVHPSLAVSTVAELITLAKSRPGEIDFASGAPGSSPHLAGELFKSMAALNIVRVPFKGAGPAINALLAGEVKLMFPNAVSIMPHIKSGRIRALAVTSLQPSALAPGIPTVASAGLPEYQALTITGMFAPAKTPDGIIHLLNREVSKFIKAPSMRERFFNAGAEIVGSSPEAFAISVKSEMAMWGGLIRRLGIRGEN